METLIFELVPEIWIYDTELLPSSKRVYPTNIPDIDTEFRIMAVDGRMQEILESLFYGTEIQKWGFSNGYLYVYASFENITFDRLKEMLNMMSPDEGGPDTWMEGNICITENSEFVPRVNRIFLSNGQQVDIN